MTVVVIKTEARKAQSDGWPMGDVTDRLTGIWMAGLDEPAIETLTKPE